MVSYHSGTGVGVILGMQAVPGALTVLEGLYFVHLEKGKETQAFIEPCLQRGLTAPEPRAAPCHERSTWSRAWQGRNSTTPWLSPSVHQGNECRLTCHCGTGLQQWRAHCHSCTMQREKGYPKCPQGGELQSPSPCQTKRQGAAGKGSTGHQPTALELQSHPGQMLTQNLFQDLLEGSLPSAHQGRLGRTGTARTLWHSWALRRPLDTQRCSPAPTCLIMHWSSPRISFTTLCRNKENRFVNLQKP